MVSRYNVWEELGISGLELDFNVIPPYEDKGDELKDYFMPPPSKFKESPRDKIVVHVEYSWANISGRPKSGKTTLALSIAREVEKYYSNHGLEVYTVVSPLLADAISKLPEEAEVATLLIDDALLTSFAAGRTRSDILNVGAYTQLRHLLLKQCPKFKYAVVLYTIQRYRSLDIVFRDAQDILILKTAENDPNDNRIIKEMVRSSELMWYLMKITEMLYRYHERNYAKYFVYVTAWGTRDIVYLKRVSEPQRIIVSNEIRDILLSEFQKPNPSAVRAAIKVLIAQAATLGVSWSFIQKNFLPLMRRKFKVSLSHDVAHKVYTRFKGLSVPTGDILEEFVEEAVSDEVEDIFA